MDFFPSETSLCLCLAALGGSESIALVRGSSHWQKILPVIARQHQNQADGNELHEGNVFLLEERRLELKTHKAHQVLQNNNIIAVTTAGGKL